MNSFSKMNLDHICYLTILSIVTFFFTVSIAVAAGVQQALEGPGSSEYYHNKVIKNSYGAGATRYYIFEPDEPKPLMGPLIVFIHGFGGTSPSAYIGWINHLVKKGNIVVFPVYQSMISSSLQFTSNAIKSTQDAIQELQSGDHVLPDLEKFATVGHSCGGILAPNVAALAKESGLPVAKAVMSVQPGIDPMFKLEDLSKIPAETLLLSIAGDRDTIVGTRDAKKIFNQTTQIPLENKDYVLMQSDRNGVSSISADHFAPCSMAMGIMSMPMFGINALDYYCLWKLFDALTDAAFYGVNRQYALGNTPEQRYMGEWSDGTPVKELVVTDNP